MKVLFIGGTGNISTAVSRLAVAQGMDLYHLNRGTGRDFVEGVTTLVADYSDEAAVRQILRDQVWDVVVNWIAFTEQDVIRDVSLFRDRTGQYIFISSASCYQKPLEHYVISESTPVVNPFSQYARNKIACEAFLLDEQRLSGFPVTIIRPSHTYDSFIPIAIGGGKEYTTAARIVAGQPVIVHGDGTSLWTVTHADDFAIGLTGLFGNERAIGEAFHITSDESLTWNQIYALLGEALGRQPKIIHITSDFICEVEPAFSDTLLGDKTYSVVFDNSKIKSFVPGFSAKIPFAEGIRRTLEWFAADPSRKVVKPETNAKIERVLRRYGGL